MAALDLMFGANTNEVNINKQGAIEASRRANTNTTSPDLAGLGNAAMGATKALFDAQSISEANGAKQDYLKMIMSPMYRDGSASTRTEMLEGVYGSDKSKAYLDSFTAYSAGNYNKEYDNRETEVDKSYYNSAAAAHKAWQERLDVPDPDGEGQLISNKQAGKGVKDFIEEYVSNRPRLEKVVVGRALMGDAYDEMNMRVMEANSLEDLNEAMKDIVDIKEPFQDPMFMTTKQKEGAAWVASKEAELNKTFALKKKEIKLNTSNYIENNPYMTDEEVSPKIIEVSIDNATGKLNSSVYNTKMEEYQKRRTSLENMNVYEADYDPTVPTDAELLKDTAVKKKHTSNITRDLRDAFTSGSEEDFNNIVKANAGYLKEAKVEGINALFNPNTDEDIQNEAWTKTKSLLDTPTGTTALRSIYGEKDLAKIMAVSVAQNFLGIDRATAIENINKMKDSPDQDRLTKDANIAMSKENKDYGPLQDEFKTLVMMSVAAGIEPEDAVDNASDVMESHIIKVGGEPGYSISGEPPKVSKNAEDFYSKAVEEQVKALKEVNGGNPIQIEVLNNGKAIARDATWGYKIKGYIDLKAIAETAEEEAFIKGPDSTITAIEAAVDKVIQPIATAARTGYVAVSPILPKPMKLVEGATKEVKDFFSHDFSKEIYDFFNPELSKEKLHRLRENQSETSKKIIDEDSISINSPTEEDVKKAIEYDILNKIGKIESDNTYDANRKGSKFYGRFQISYDTAKETFFATGLDEKSWKTPEGQVATMNVLLEKYTNQLINANMPVTAFNLYGMHQQGAKGFKEIMSGGKLSSDRIRNMRKNLPGQETLKDSEVADAWIAHWKNRI